MPAAILHKQSHEPLYITILILTQEATPSAWQTVEGGDRLRGESAGASQRHFWCLLGHLYARARAALGSMDGHFDMPISVASSPQVGINCPTIQCRS